VQLLLALKDCKGLTTRLISCSMQCHCFWHTSSG